MASPAKNDKAVMAFALLLVVCCCCSCSSSVLAFTGKGTDPAPAPGPAPPSNNNTYITEFGLISPNTGHNWHAEGLTPEQCRAKAVEKGDNAYGMSTQYHPDVITGKNKVSCWSRKIPGVGSDAFTGLVPTGQGGNLDSHIAGCTTIGKKVSNSCGIPPPALIGSPFNSGDVVSLKGGKDNKYCSDRPEGMICNVDNLNQWEKFTISKNVDNTYSLKGGKDNKYCSDRPEGMICNVGHLDAWEKFTISKI